MIIMQEIGENTYPNHIYYVNDSKSKILAYIPINQENPIYLLKPLSFSTSRRKFKILKKINE
jgi:hypothetical protein